MSPILWDNCRRNDGSINLCVAAKMTGCRVSTHALLYLLTIEKMYPINSRQAATVAIASALEISERKPDDKDRSALSSSRNHA